MNYSENIISQYQAALEMLKQTIMRCPDYEEPYLRRTFGPEYEPYRRRVRRWRTRLKETGE